MLKRKGNKRLFLPSLVIASFATQPPSLITGLLLIELGATFNLPVGLAGQIRTASSTAMVITALLMSVLSTRYRHETLLIAGLISLAISSLGCYSSTSFTILTLFYSLSGIAIAIIGSMSNALIGEHISEEKRSGAIGWFQAGTSIAYLVMSPAVSTISRNGGWRMTFLLLLLSLSIARA